MEQMSEDEEDPNSTDGTMVEHSLPIDGTPKLQDERSNSSIHILERRIHILEDVEGEIKMEDASPFSECEGSFCKNFSVGAAGSEALCSLTWNEGNLYSPSLFWDPPPLPQDMPPSTPPLPTSPPPPLPERPH